MAAAAGAAGLPPGAGPAADGMTPPVDQGANRVATLLAKLALAGHVVHRGPASDFMVCKYGLSRWCRDLGELEDFARQLGVKL